jgi:hypothetical protein
MLWQIAKLLFLAVVLAIAFLAISLAVSNKSNDHLQELDSEIQLPPAKRTRKIGEF